jgi:hypothetical protein
MVNTIENLQSFLTIIFLLGGLIFNIAFWYFKLKDIEERLKIAGKRFGATDTRLNRLINWGNRKLDWDFDYENDRDE